MCVCVFVCVCVCVCVTCVQFWMIEVVKVVESITFPLSARTLLISYTTRCTWALSTPVFTQDTCSH